MASGAEGLRTYFYLRAESQRARRHAMRWRPQALSSRIGCSSRRWRCSEPAHPVDDEEREKFFGYSTEVTGVEPSSIIASWR